MTEHPASPRLEDAEAASILVRLAAANSRAEMLAISIADYFETADDHALAQALAAYERDLREGR